MGWPVFVYAPGHFPIQIESPSGARFRGLEGDFSYFSGISPPSPGCTHFAVSVTVPPETKSFR